MSGGLLSSRENEHKHFYLIDGELFWDMPPGFLHGHIAGLIFHYFLIFAAKHDLGKPTVESGYYSADDRSTLLAPDVAFVSKEKIPLADPGELLAAMPDLAVEIQSPSNTLAELRRKAAVYLANGTELVWLVLPARAAVEVWRMGPDGEAGARDSRQRQRADRRAGLARLHPGFAEALSRLKLRLPDRAGGIAAAQEVVDAAQRLGFDASV